MDLKRLTSPCGLDCFNCQVYEKNITDEMRNYLAGVLKKAPDEVACKGCREQNGCSIYPLPCATLDCVKSNKVEFCFECDKFPCDKFNPCADGAQKYPHNLKVFNLCRISKVGLDKWAQEAKSIRNKYFAGKFIVGKGPILK